MSILKPEIYTTNGNIVEDNELYFKAKWPLTAKYSLAYNRDLMIFGEKFKEKIPKSKSVKVSAKVTLLESKGVGWNRSILFLVITMNLQLMILILPGFHNENISIFCWKQILSRRYVEPGGYKGRKGKARWGQSSNRGLFI